VDELDDDAADEVRDGPAQLVPDERLERCLGRGHKWSLRPVRSPVRWPLALAAELPLGALWAVDRDLVVGRRTLPRLLDSRRLTVAFNAAEIRVHRPRM
jgi:hypothetical protein